MRYNSVVLAFITLTSCLFSTALYAQDGAKMKFGKVSKEEFNLSSAKDTGAHAIIISEIGSSAFETNGSSLAVVYKVHKRYKIVDKSGYDYANVSVNLYKGNTNNSQEDISKIKASAYNLENGEIKETKLESKDIYTEQTIKNYVTKKFAIPGVKEGTIIEYSYTVTSPFWTNIRSWTYQHSIPTLWSEYTVSIPDFLRFVQLGTGFEPYVEKTRNTSHTVFSFRYEPYGATGASENVSLSSEITHLRWAAKDLPAIREEKFITTTDNYVNRIEFQLSSYKFGEEAKNTKNTWPKLMEDLNKDEDFGAAMGKNGNFMDNITDDLIKGATSDQEKASRIFNWVKTNVICNDTRGIWTSQRLKTTLTSKKGGVSDINLLLVGLLRRAKLDAFPIILSTRDHGYVSYYPLLSRFNYVIAAVRLDDKVVTLDATDPLLGFGKLLPSCYNGDARIVNEEGTNFTISADSLHEAEMTSVSFDKFEKGVFHGTFQQRPTYLQSYNIRKEIQSKKKEGFFDRISKSFNGDMEISNGQVNDLDSLNDAIMVSYDFKMKGGEETDVIYLSPFIGSAYKENIFKAAERKFPVEMNAVYDEMYSLNFLIPEGYVIDELPKSAIVKFNETEGIFQYLIQATEDRVQMRCRIQLKKATFEPEDYPSLRDFWGMIVKKQAEQIVLKKKKA